MIGRSTGNRREYKQGHSISNRTLFLTMALLLLPGLMRAQEPDTLWSRTFGGSNIDIGHSVRQTSDGGFIVTGYTRSYGSTGGRNVWLLKTDSDGVEEWNNAFGGDDDDEGHSVRQTTDGGYVTAGLTSSFGAGGKDVLLVKCDSLGEEEWSVTFGGTYDDEAYSVLQTPDEGYLLAGATSSFGSGSRDVWLIRTDSSGNEIWNRTHGGYGSDGAWSARRTSDGGFIVTGWTFSHGPGYLGNAWLLKTDSSGQEEWSTFYGGDDADRGYDVRQTFDGGYVIAGYTGSIGSGLYDMLLIKTDSLGNQEWMKAFGGTGRDYGNSVVQTEDGGYTVAGHTLSFGAGSEDLWLVRTDGEGSQEWYSAYGGSSSDVAYSIQKTTDSGYIATGHTLSFGAGLHDVWLLRFATDQTGVEHNPAVPSGLDLGECRPNPFFSSTALSYEVPFAGRVRMAIYSIRGRVVRTLVDRPMEAGSHSIVWDGKNDAGERAAGGVYFCRLEAAGRTVSRKLLLLEAGSAL